MDAQVDRTQLGGGRSAGGRTFSGVMKAGGFNSTDGWSLIQNASFLGGGQQFEGDQALRLSDTIGGSNGGIAERVYSTPVLDLGDITTEIRLWFKFFPIDNAASYRLERRFTDSDLNVRTLPLSLSFVSEWTPSNWLSLDDPNTLWSEIVKVQLEYQVSGKNPFEPPPDLLVDSMEMRFKRGGHLVSLGGRV